MFGFNIVYFKGSQIDISVLQSKIMRIAFILENSTDPDKMSHLGLHCFSKNLTTRLMVSSILRVNCS